MDTATVTSLIGSWTLWSPKFAILSIMCFCSGFIPKDEVLSYTLCKDGTNTSWIKSAKLIFESIIWLCWDMWRVCDISMTFVWCFHEMSRSISHARTPSLVHSSIVLCLSKGQSQWQVVSHPSPQPHFPFPSTEMYEGGAQETSQPHARTTSCGSFWHWV